MKKFAGALLVALALSATPFGTASAAVPNSLTYQGTLTDSAGQPVTGSKSVTFSLYTVATGGTAFWTDTQTVNLVGGRISVTLGSTTKPLDPAKFTGETYIGIKVGTDTEMPRQKLASVAYAFQAGDGGVPKGGIIMWSGALNAIPAGWALCNGSNGTPNLSDKFIVGTGTIHPHNTPGGVKEHNIAHTHAIGEEAPGTSASGDHAHHLDVQFYSCIGDCSDGSNDGSKAVGSDGHGHHLITDTWGAGNHAHTVNAHSHGAATGSTGTTLDNRPPYYALAFIMKL